MKINFRLRNTGSRSMRLNCLDRALLLEPDGVRGCEAVVGLDEWRFRYRGEANKVLKPYIEAGLRIIIETDLDQTPLNSNLSLRSVQPTVKPVMVSNEPEVTTIYDSNRQIGTLGRINIEEKPRPRVVSPKPPSKTGIQKTLINNLTAEQSSEVPQEITRVPHSSEELQAPPPVARMPMTDARSVQEMLEEKRHEDKVLRLAANMAAKMVEQTDSPNIQEAVKRKRGRPRKTQVSEIAPQEPIIIEKEEPKEEEAQLLVETDTKEDDKLIV